MPKAREALRRRVTPMGKVSGTRRSSYLIACGLTPSLHRTTMRAPSGALRRMASSPDKPRHMDVYPSRNVDIRSLRVPAPHNNKLNACGDRLRSAGAFH